MPVISRTVNAVHPLSNYMLSVSFTNGEERNYNVAALFARQESFRTLASVNGLFEQVKVDAGGYGISWNDELDLSCDELYYKGV